jgi:hypothetical protein
MFNDDTITIPNTPLKTTNSSRNTIHSYIQRQAMQQPNKVAIIVSEKFQISYQQLNATLFGCCIAWR